MSPFRDQVRIICQRLPGAEVSDPWGGGHDAWKVGGKMFACIGAVTPGVSVKCASLEQAEMLRQAGVGSKPRYFHASWLHLAEECPADELEHRLCEGYRIIRSGLTRKARAALGDY